MNDFTKEELLYISKMLEKDIANSMLLALNNEKLFMLYAKVKDMIDNYCEPCQSAHEFYDRLVCEQCGLVEGF